MKATAKFYKSHPASRAKKKKYDTKYESTPERKAYRAGLSAYNRLHGSVGDNLDSSHRGGKIVGLENQSKNRGRKEKSRLVGSKRKKK